jgi:hypothetical protein
MRNGWLVLSGWQGHGQESASSPWFGGRTNAMTATNEQQVSYPCRYYYDDRRSRVDDKNQQAVKSMSTVAYESGFSFTCENYERRLKHDVRAACSGLDDFP